MSATEKEVLCIGPRTLDAAAWSAFKAFSNNPTATNRKMYVSAYRAMTPASIADHRITLKGAK